MGMFSQRVRQVKAEQDGHVRTLDEAGEKIKGLIEGLGEDILVALRAEWQERFHCEAEIRSSCMGGSHSHEWEPGAYLSSVQDMRAKEFPDGSIRWQKWDPEGGHAWVDSPDPKGVKAWCEEMTQKLGVKVEFLTFDMTESDLTDEEKAAEIPKDGKCHATLVFGDDYGDNSCTMRCQLDLGHSGPHSERGRASVTTDTGKDAMADYELTWKERRGP